MESSVRGSRGKMKRRIQQCKPHHDARNLVQSLLVWNLCGKQNCTCDCISSSDAVIGSWSRKIDIKSKDHPVYILEFVSGIEAFWSDRIQLSVSWQWNILEMYFVRFPEFHSNCSHVLEHFQWIPITGIWRKLVESKQVLAFS